MAYAYLHVEHEIHSYSETDIKHCFPIIDSYLLYYIASSQKLLKIIVQFSSKQSGKPLLNLPLSCHCRVLPDLCQ